MEENPYQAPRVAEVAAEEAISDPERIRREHLKHETSLKGAGSLIFLGGLLLGIVAATSVAGFATQAGSISGSEMVLLLVFVILCAFQITVGIGLRGLAPWSWIPALIASALSLFSFPVGTLLGGYFLYLLIAPKGRRILSAEYREVRRQTPHIKYRTPWWMWAILLLVVLVVVGSIVWLVTPRP